jgi:RNA polymerase sigma-70 factor (ECF subfamily)
VVPAPSHSFPDEPARAAAAREAAAFRRLQIVHGPVLLSFVTRLTGGDTRSAGAVVEATLAHARDHPDARGPDGRWSRAWLFAEARRRCLAHPATVPERPAGPAAEVRAALASLPEHLRVTLVEIYFRDRSVSEVADLLEVPADTVVTWTWCGLEVFREALCERGFDLAPRPDGQDCDGIGA